MNTLCAQFLQQFLVVVVFLAYVILLLDCLFDVVFLHLFYHRWVVICVYKISWPGFFLIFQFHCITEIINLIHAYKPDVILINSWSL